VLAHDRLGAGRPLVLVHGLGSRREAWAPAARIAAAEREVIPVDLPGFGDSEWDGGAVSVAGLASSLQDFFADAGLECPDLAGNSLGGGVGFELARRGAIRSLTAFSPIGFASAGQQRWADGAFRVARALGRTAPDGMSPRLQANLARPSLFIFAFGHPWRTSDEEILATAEAAQVAEAFSPALQAIGSYRLQRPQELREVPTTIAWGSRDVLIPARSNSGRARKALPWARHVALPGCGHVPFFDDPDACARVLIEGSGGAA